MCVCLFVCSLSIEVVQLLQVLLLVFLNVHKGTQFPINVFLGGEGEERAEARRGGRRGEKGRRKRRKEEEEKGGRGERRKRRKEEEEE